MLNDGALEKSEVVANSTMNRGRGMEGPNSYERDLGLNPHTFLAERLAVMGQASWLDLCCGEGRALIETAMHLQKPAWEGPLSLIGVDLTPLFRPVPTETAGLTLIAASLHEWEPPREQRFDLITCVHGLHYIGDKLGLLARAASWLTDNGLLVAHLDLQNLRLEGTEEAATYYRRLLTKAGFTYTTRRGIRLLTLSVIQPLLFPLRYLGANDAAGPNRTGQPAVDSYYAPL